MESASKSSESRVERRRVTIPTRWGTTGDLPTLYANQLYVSRSGPEYYLIFGELEPPILIGDEDAPEVLYTKPVAKIAVSPEAMLRFAQAIADIAGRSSDEDEEEAKREV